MAKERLGDTRTRKMTCDGVADARVLGDGGVHFLGGSRHCSGGGGAAGRELAGGNL